MFLQNSIILWFRSNKNDLLLVSALTHIIRGIYIRHKINIWHFYSLQVQFFPTSDGLISVNSISRQISIHLRTSSATIHQSKSLIIDCARFIFHKENNSRIPESRCCVEIQKEIINVFFCPSGILNSMHSGA